MNIAALKTDKVGIIASTLCMVHCMATPFLFLAKTCSATCCEASPNWWKALDFVFLIISFFAVYQSSKNTSKLWVQKLMWLSWAFLLAIILNENMHLFSLPEFIIYIPAIMLVALHFYNLKYCKCQGNQCCVN